MDYQELEKITSSQRLKRYKTACSGIENKAVDLYLKNIELGSEIFKMISIVEIALRNRINEFLIEKLENENWLREMGRENSYFCKNNHKGFLLLSNTLKYKVFISAPNSKILTEMSLGFWTNLFLSPYYEKLNWKTAFIFKFPRKNHKCGIMSQETGIRRRAYDNLTTILNIRNRICHLEPSVFNALNKVDYTTIEKALEAIQDIAIGIEIQNDYLLNLDKKIRESLP